MSQTRIRLSTLTSMAIEETMCCRSTISDYKILPVQFSEEFKTCRYIYFKQHVVRDPHPEKPTERTLILLNVPPYCNEQCFKRIFSEVGLVTNVFFHAKPMSGLDKTENSKLFKTHTHQGYKVAYVVFKQEKSVKKALKMKFEAPCILSTVEEPLCVGVKKWATEYADSIPDEKILQSEVESFMENYDTKIEKEKDVEKLRADEADDEGWVTVSKRGKKKGFTRTEGTINKINKITAKKRSRLELQSFYTFQVREKKREHHEQFLKQYEEAKEKVALLKATRKFKPY